MNEDDLLTQSFARIKALEDELADLQDLHKAWFDTSDKCLDDLGPYLLGAFKGYLRTCRSGGLSTSDSDAAESLFDSFVGSSLGHSIVPFVMTLAADEIKRRDSRKT